MIKYMRKNSGNQGTWDTGMREYLFALCVLFYHVPKGVKLV